LLLVILKYSIYSILSTFYKYLSFECSEIASKGKHRLILTILIHSNRVSFIWSFYSTRITREVCVCVCVCSDRQQLIDFAHRQLDLQRHDGHVHKTSTSLLSWASNVNERSDENPCAHLVAARTCELCLYRSIRLLYTSWIKYHRIICIKWVAFSY